MAAKEQGKSVENLGQTANPSNTPIDHLAIALAVAVPTSIWQVAEVKDQPEVRLTNWSIREIHPRGTRHFVGYHSTDREGRVSSTIVLFDPSSGKGRTKSGRVYCLEGPPGYSQNAEYVWENWRNLQGPGAATWIDVTQNVISR